MKLKLFKTPGITLLCLVALKTSYGFSDLLRYLELPLSQAAQIIDQENLNIATTLNEPGGKLSNAELSSTKLIYGNTNTPIEITRTFPLSKGKYQATPIYTFTIKRGVFNQIQIMYGFRNIKGNTGALVVNTAYDKNVEFGHGATCWGGSYTLRPGALTEGQGYGVSSLQTSTLINMLMEEAGFNCPNLNEI